MTKIKAKDMFTIEEMAYIEAVSAMFNAQAILINGRKLNVPTPKQANSVPNS